MRILLLPGVLLLVLVGSPAFPATWVVDPGGGGQATTIAGGLALASAGDSVVVVPGTYYENRLLMKSDVALTSQSGPDFTTIDGSDAGPILWCQGVNAAATIQGFTFTHARGDSVGGAIVCLAVSSPRIVGNIFVNNTSLYGAAIGCAAFSSPIVEDNVITDNVAFAECGGVLGLHYCDLVVRNNVFRRNQSLTRSGGAMWFGDQCRVTVTGNIVADNLCPAGGGGGIWLGNTTSGIMTVEGNLFVRNSCGIHGGAIYGGNVNVTIRTNTIDLCTAVTEGGGIWIWTGTSIMEQNIVTHCNVGAVGTEGTALVGCNDLFGNPDGDYIGTLVPGPGDLFLDPRYCDPGHDDYTLAENSPCLHPAGCDRMGAFGQGCGATAVEPTTWGALKGVFR